MKINLEEIGIRLKQYLNIKKIGINQLGRMSGSSGAQISNIINGRNYGIKKFLAIGNACPDLNLLWLLTGDGEMLLSGIDEKNGSVSIPVPSELQNQIQTLTEEKKLLFDQIRELKLQKGSLEGAVTYQEMTIEAYKNSLSVLSASNQDLKEMLSYYKNILEAKNKDQKTA